MTKILHQMKNGLPVLLIDTHSFPSLTVMLLVGVGSRYENKSNNGISHFMEHMAFKGSEKYRTSYEISSIIEGMGGVFNAYTSKDHTGFYVKATRDNYARIVEIMSQMILHPLLLQEEIDKEKGVIKEEINMYEDNPASKVSEYFDNRVYEGNPLAFDIAGTAQTVDSFTRETFTSYLDDHYHTHNAVMVIAGGLGGKKGDTSPKQYESYIQVVEEQFGSWQKKAKKMFMPFSHTQSRPQKHIFYKKTEQSHFCLGYRGIPFTDPRRHVASILGTILGGGMSSRLFIEVRERRGLCYYISMGKEMYEDTGVIVTQAGVTNDVKKINEALKVIRGEQEKIQAGNVSDFELQNAKQFLIGRFLLSLEDSYKVASFSGGRYLFEKDLTTPEEIVKKIQEVTKEDVQKLAQELFQHNHAALSLIGPCAPEDIDFS